MINPVSKFISPEEYLALEERAEFRNEYYGGEIFAMSGGSINHNQITLNLATNLTQQFRHKPCRVFSSDVRLHIPKSGLYTYPDVMIICGKLEFLPKRDDTVLNPSVLVEVWSDSTQAYDRGKKFALYRQIPTLQEYVMIDQTRAYVEHFRRDGHFWVLETLEQMDTTLALPALECQIPLAAIYEKVEWQNLPSESEK